MLHHVNIFVHLFYELAFVSDYTKDLKMEVERTCTLSCYDCT